MNRRIVLSLIGLALGAGCGRASVLTFQANVDTSGISAAAGYIELQFNQANALTSGAGSARVFQFVSTGYMLGGAAPPSAGVSGSFASPPVIIPNDQGAAKYYDEIVTTWGQGFRFLLNVDSAATDSGFFVFLLDAGFAPIVGPLSGGEIANVLIDSGGAATAAGSAFAGGFASAFAIPEPTPVTLLGVGLAALLLWRCRYVILSGSHGYHHWQCGLDRSHLRPHVFGQERGVDPAPASRHDRP